jgi:hypothetical protein
MDGWNIFIEDSLCLVSISNSSQIRASESRYHALGLLQSEKLNIIPKRDRGAHTLPVVPDLGRRSEYIEYYCSEDPRITQHCCGILITFRF